MLGKHCSLIKYRRNDSWSLRRLSSSSATTAVVCLRGVPNISLRSPCLFPSWNPLFLDAKGIGPREYNRDGLVRISACDFLAMRECTQYFAVKQPSDRQQQQQEAADGATVLSPPLCNGHVQSRLSVEKSHGPLSKVRVPVRRDKSRVFGFSTMCDAKVEERDEVEDRRSGTLQRPSGSNHRTIHAHFLLGVQQSVSFCGILELLCILFRFSVQL